jgi:DNA-directed RNA polymerase subunit F
LSLELLELFPRAGVNNQERQFNREQRKKYHVIFEQLGKIDTKKNNGLELLLNWHEPLTNEQRETIFTIFEALLEAEELPPSIEEMAGKFSLVVDNQQDFYRMLVDIQPNIETTIRHIQNHTNGKHQ